VNDIIPSLRSLKRIKVGTFKIDARGTKMGERFVKKIFDHAIHENAQEIYVTIFPEHVPLIVLLREVMGSYSWDENLRLMVLITDCP